MYLARLKKITQGLIAFIMLFCSINSIAQTTVITGRVTDANTKTPLEFASIYFPGTSAGVNANAEGYFELKTDNEHTKIQVSLVGYQSATLKIQPGKTQTINIKLQPDNRTLKEVLIKPKKARYRNKDNPAVELIRQVIAHRDQNKNGAYEYIEYEKYEKLDLALINTPEKLRKNRLFRSFKYLVNNIDTTTLPDKALMPLYLQEKLSEHFERRKGDRSKTIIVADKKVNFGEYLDNAGLNTYLKHMYQDVDIYSNNITVMTNQFLSPIANLAPTFYQFYIVDTVVINNTKLVGLSFYPRNKSDMLFQGRLYVTLDSNYAVEKVRMTVNKNINLNWVRDLDISLDFEKESDNTYHLSKSDIRTDFGISEKRSGGVYGQRVVSYRKYQLENVKPDDFYKGDAVVLQEDAVKKDDDFWLVSRHDTLTAAESHTYANIDSLQKSKSFKRVMDIGTMLIAGYKRITPYVELGPVNTFYSFNPVEGFRLRIGGRTTTRFSKRYNLESYAAYGFKDERWKYYIGGAYSFTNHSIYEFPVRTLRANYQKDTKIPGQELQFVQEDNVLLSIKRGVNNRWLYNDIYNIDYLHEFRNHTSFRIGYKNWKQEAAGQLEYLNEIGEPSHLQKIKDITTSEVSLELRWAPNEEFYQGKLYRIPMPNRYPVFTVRAIAGIKGFLNGQYNYQNLTINIYKRVYLSQLGYSDIVLEGGNIFGKVPYPLLAIHRANQTYSLQLQSYNLMNFLEFTSDHYASIVIDHCFNGFVFNKIPLFKKLRFREYINVKMLYGGVRNENLPTNDPSLFKFPVYPDGRASTYTLAGEPYIEGSVGIGNILNFFRLDLVKRFTYLENPNISKLGIRGRFKFDF